MESALDTAAGQVPVFIAHGANDEVVSFDKALETHEILNNAGFDVTFCEFAGGHGLSVDVLRAAASWIAQRDGIPMLEESSGAADNLESP